MHYRWFEGVVLHQTVSPFILVDQFFMVMVILRVIAWCYPAGGWRSWSGIHCIQRRTYAARAQCDVVNLLLPDVALLGSGEHVRYLGGCARFYGRHPAYQKLAQRSACWYVWVAYLDAVNTKPTVHRMRLQYSSAPI